MRRHGGRLPPAERVGHPVPSVAVPVPAVTVALGVRGPGQVLADVLRHVLVRHQPRYQTVDLDAVRSPLDGQGPHEALHAGLGRRAVRETGAAGPGVGRADVDDRPGRARGQMPSPELTGHQKRSREGDVDDRLPGVRRHVLGGDGEVGGRVVDQYVGQRASVEHLADALRIPDVTDRGPDPGAQLRQLRTGGGQMPLTAADDQKIGAQPGELRRDRPPESGTATGDQHQRAVVRPGGQGARAHRGRGGEAGERCGVHGGLDTRCRRGTSGRGGRGTPGAGSGTSSRLGSGYVRAE